MPEPGWERLAHARHRVKAAALITRRGLDADDRAVLLEMCGCTELDVIRALVWQLRAARGQF